MFQWITVLYGLPDLVFAAYPGLLVAGVVNGAKSRVSEFCSLFAKGFMETTRRVMFSSSKDDCARAPAYVWLAGGGREKRFWCF